MSKIGLSNTAIVVLALVGVMFGGRILLFAAGLLRLLIEIGVLVLVALVILYLIRSMSKKVE